MYYSTSPVWWNILFNLKGHSLSSVFPHAERLHNSLEQLGRERLFVRLHSACAHSDTLWRSSSRQSTYLSGAEIIPSIGSAAKLMWKLYGFVCNGRDAPVTRVEDWKGFGIPSLSFSSLQGRLGRFKLPNWQHRPLWPNLSPFRWSLTGIELLGSCSSALKLNVFYSTYAPASGAKKRRLNTVHPLRLTASIWDDGSEVEGQINSYQHSP